MRRCFAALLSCGLIVSGCSPPPAPPEPTPPWAEAASCQSYDQVNLKALAAFEAELPKRLARAAEVAIEQKVSLTPPAGYEAWRVVATNLDHGWISDGVTVAFGAKDGRWWMRSHERGYGVKPMEGPMPAAAVAELEAALAQDCLYREPVYMPDTVPMKNGRADKCFDGVSKVLQIQGPGRRRDSFQLCQGWGFTDEVRAALVHAVSPPPP